MYTNEMFLYEGQWEWILNFYCSLNRPHQKAKRKGKVIDGGGNDSVVKKVQKQINCSHYPEEIFERQQ